MITEATLIDSIIDRLVLILDDSGLFTTVQDTYPDVVTDDLLPFVVVSDRSALSVTKPNQNTLRYVRQFSIEILFASQTVAARTTGNHRKVARNLLVQVPTLIMNAQRLQFNDNGLQFVGKVEIQSDEGIGNVGFDKETYIGIMFLVNVEYDLKIN